MLRMRVRTRNRNKGHKESRIPRIFSQELNGGLRRRKGAGIIRVIGSRLAAGNQRVGIAKAGGMVIPKTPVDFISIFPPPYHESRLHLGSSLKFQRELYRRIRELPAITRNFFTAGISPAYPAQLPPGTALRDPRRRQPASSCPTPGCRALLCPGQSDGPRPEEVPASGPSGPAGNVRGPPAGRCRGPRSAPAR